MLIKRLAAALSTTAFILMPVFGMAQTISDITPRLRLAAEADPAAMTFLKRIEKQIGREQQGALLRQLLNTLYQTVPAGSLTKDLIDQAEAKLHAQRRAKQIGFFLGWDLDGDGSITEAERKAFPGVQAVDLDLLFARGDDDQDGTISLAEIHRYAEEKTAKTKPRTTAHHLMLFDVDQDGTVTTTEIVTTIDALTTEPLALSNMRGAQPNSDVTGASECTAPKPSEDADVIVLSGYEGAALSTVSVAGLDRATTVGQVIIEPGDKPVYLFLSSSTHVLWDVSGDTKRLKTVVVQKRNTKVGPGAGIVGVPKDKVHFVDAKKCISPVSSVEGGKGMLAYRQVSKSLAREPDHMLAFYTIGKISLPSGAGSKSAKSGFDTLILNGRRYDITPEGLKPQKPSELEKPTLHPPGVAKVLRSLTRFHPGGVHTIDANAVVAPGKPDTYDVLPQEAGLLQLLVNGKMAYTKDGFFVIEEPIARFPASLAGAHGVKFLLGNGVPMPGGSPGHSSVISLETGDCLVKHCR